MDENGRLRRENVPLEMNAFCRRALAKGVELAQTTGGRCTVLSLGPPSAVDVLREALAWGADEAVLLSDPVFAGSDTLATARALAVLIERQRPFDLVLAGRSSLDAETGQVGPELAELLGLPFAGPVRELNLDENHESLHIRCEQDDGGYLARVALPAVLSTAERLCSPAKVPAEIWASIPVARVTRLDAGNIGSDGPWGAAGSPTSVSDLRVVESRRSQISLTGSVEEQVRVAIPLLEERGVLSPETAGPVPSVVSKEGNGQLRRDARCVAVLVEADRRQLARELLGAGASLAANLGGEVVAIITSAPNVHELWDWGADAAVEICGARSVEDVADAACGWVEEAQPEIILASATFWGREIASRVAARLGAGLIGDALDLEVVQGRLRCSKSAFGGSRIATVLTSSHVQMATVRPGVLELREPRTGGRGVRVAQVVAAVRGRIEVVESWRDDDCEALTRARVVVGVGMGVDPEDYGQIRRLAAVLGAEIAATRKVTDRGWMPHSRQVGITGKAISPQLYIAIGISGKLNHMIGVRGARTVLAVNSDRDALIFRACDLGIVGDWREAGPFLVAGLSEFLERPAFAGSGYALGIEQPDGGGGS